MEILLDRELILHLEDAKTNVEIPFTLKRNYEALELLCSYEPKHCDDENLARRLIEEAITTFAPPPYREKIGPWQRHRSSVVNLITVSIDAGETYLGCAHRHANEQRHIISADFSSPGFCRCAPQPGPWRAMLNVHAVVCAEVWYRLRVLGLDDRGEGHDRLEMF
ncbi:MAG: hypothetical protein LBG76_06770 [Treponema sp.]|jgi:hypothetical protein|nr:hypothetical protein [Treponema sp.]